MNNSNEPSFIVHLLDERGRPRNRVNIMTRAGADEYLLQQDERGGPRRAGESSDQLRPHISPTLEGMRAERLAYDDIDNASRQRRQQLDGKLVPMYVMLSSLAESASPPVFAKVPASEFKFLVGHVCGVLVRLTNSNNSNYRRTGVLYEADQECLETLMCHSLHENFVREAVQWSSSHDDNNKNMLQVLAEFCAAAKPVPHQLPAPKVAHTIVSIANNVRLSLVGQGTDEDEEKVFKLLESTGLLGQVIRCLTQPGPDGSGAPSPGHVNFLDRLSRCAEFVRKRMAPGTPTGEILAQVVGQRDACTGNDRPAAVMARLENLHRLASVSHSAHMNTRNLPVRGQLKFCRNCNKSEPTQEFQRSLKQCSRCKQAFYCSRECQVADWKDHKTTCQPVGSASEAKRSEKRGTSIQLALNDVLQKNYFDVMTKIVEVCEETGVSKKNLVVELDFFPNSETGSAPILSTPPSFKVAPAARYYQGSRPDEPDWFHKGTDVYEGNVAAVRLGLKDQHSRMTADHVLVLLRWADGQPSVYRVLVQAPVTMVPIYGDRALEAFKKCMDGDDLAFEDLFPESFQQHIIARRDMGGPANMTEAQMIERARHALRMFGGDF